MNNNQLHIFFSSKHELQNTFFHSWDCKWFEMKLRWSFHWEKATASQEIWFVDVAPIFEGSKSNGTNEQIRNQTLTCEYLVGNVCRTHLHRFPFAHGQLSMLFFFFFRCLANWPFCFGSWWQIFCQLKCCFFFFFSTPKNEICVHGSIFLHLTVAGDLAQHLQCSPCYAGRVWCQRDQTINNGAARCLGSKNNLMRRH